MNRIIVSMAACNNSRDNFLSVNKISSLADVQYCKNLRELYVRKNEIKNLNEVCYLKNLPHLKALWLGENPCSVSDNLYRMTVIKNLPSLEKLDDIKIEPEERQDAMKKGRDLIHPEDSDYENSSPTRSPVRVSRSPPVSGRSSDQDYEDSESRKSYSPEYDQVPYGSTTESKYSQGSDRYENKNSYKTTRRPSEIYSDQHFDNGVGNENLVNEKQTDTQCTTFLNRCNSDTSVVLKKEKSLTECNMRITHHNSTNQEDYEGDCATESKVAGAYRATLTALLVPFAISLPFPNSKLYLMCESNPGDLLKEAYCYCSPNQYDRRSQVNISRSRERGEGTRCSSSDGSGRASPQKGQERAYRQFDNYRIDAERYAKASPYPPRRPVTRNSNLLSAALCLIKELDYPSLEVVAIAVRCRMDEFDD
ncbi:hypothetical protein RUM43_011931 [Polyplax serrata]|uniref:U2A'/phosphoprotein 32 family A C-terminal domain-containing protein n=1 Tax=Polyplax serrata TaxID=468196 RepID=A0AAN8RZJ3_POLSC